MISLGNPFSDIKKELDKKKAAEEEWEEVDGPMTCQTTGCWDVAQTGLYSKKLKKVTWICVNKHISSMDYEF